MKFRLLMVRDPHQRLIRLASVLWGTDPRDAGHKNRLSFALRARVFDFWREHDAWFLVILGLRLYMKRATRGVFVGALLAMILLAPEAHAQGMTHADWMNILEPVIASVLVALAGLIATLLTILTKRANAYLVAHDQIAAAKVLTVANAAINKEVETSASVIAGKIDRGELDPTDRKAWEGAAISEVALIKQRLPDIAKAAAEAGTPLLTQVMARVDDKTVASPTINAGVSDPPKPALLPA